MKTKLTLLTLATAGLLSAASTRGADEPVPPTPPANPPAAAPAASPDAKRERGPGGQRGDRLAMMKETLGLSTEQIEKIKPILEKSREQLTALRADQALSREDRAAKMKEITAASAAEIKPILTSEQAEKWKVEQEKRREAMEKRRAEQEKK